MRLRSNEWQTDLIKKLENTFHQKKHKQEQHNADIIKQLDNEAWTKVEALPFMNVD
jgi:hypothetical protein